MNDDFRELPDHEIDRLDDGRLLAYIDAARTAGKGDTAAMNGIRHLIFRHMGSVVARVGRKIPPHLVEDVAHDAMVEAISSAFAGTTIKEFHKWLGVIVARQIADFYRGPKGRQLALDREAAQREDDDGAPVDMGADAGYGASDVRDVADQVLSTRSEQHQRVIEMQVWEDASAREVAAATGVSEANAYQILRRFRVDLRAALESDTDPSS